MANLIFSLNATLPIFLVMMAGWAFRQMGIISDSFASQMNKFVFQIALPVSLFTQLDDIGINALNTSGHIPAIRETRRPPCECPHRYRSVTKSSCFA